MEDNQEIKIEALNLEDLNQVAGGAQCQLTNVTTLEELENAPGFAKLKRKLDDCKTRTWFYEEIPELIKNYARDFCGIEMSINLTKEFIDKYWLLS